MRHTIHIKMPQSLPAVEEKWAEMWNTVDSNSFMLSKRALQKILERNVTSHWECKWPGNREVKLASKIIFSLYLESVNTNQRSMQLWERKENGVDRKFGTIENCKLLASEFTIQLSHWWGPINCVTNKAPTGCNFTSKTWINCRQTIIIYIGTKKKM